MYTLFYMPGTASMPVHWMLIELGVPFTLELVDFDSGAQKSAEHLARNPSGQVPTLVMDGQPHSESAALLMLLAERHPERGFAPPPGHPDRADYLELMVYLANNALPGFRAYFYPQDFADTESEAQVKEHAERRLHAALDRLDARLSDGREFLLGGSIGAADFLFTILCRWTRNMTKPAQSWPHLALYLARMKQREGLRAVHEREGLTDWIGAG
jgi:glutathione S-transferase